MSSYSQNSGHLFCCAAPSLGETYCVLATVPVFLPIFPIHKIHYNYIVALCLVVESPNFYLSKPKPVCLPTCPNHQIHCTNFVGVCLVLGSPIYYLYICICICMFLHVNTTVPACLPTCPKNLIITMIFFSFLF